MHWLCVLFFRLVSTDPNELFWSFVSLSSTSASSASVWDRNGLPMFDSTDSPVCVCLHISVVYRVTSWDFPNTIQIKNFATSSEQQVTIENVSLKNIFQLPCNSLGSSCKTLTFTFQTSLSMTRYSAPH